jgi:hypothetical protein
VHSPKPRPCQKEKVRAEAQRARRWTAWRTFFPVFSLRSLRLCANTGPRGFWLRLAALGLCVKSRMHGYGLRQSERLNSRIYRPGGRERALHQINAPHGPGTEIRLAPRRQGRGQMPPVAAIQ